MAYSITLAHSRGLITDAQRDEWFTLVSSVGLSMDHELFTEELVAVATEAIKKTRDGKQRFAVPDGAFGKCVFLNDVPIEELCAALRTHKAFIKERYGSGEGKEAYVDAGDLGAEPEAYANGAKANGANGHAAASLKSNGVDKPVKAAAVKAGAVPVDGTGHLTNGVSRESAGGALRGGK
jgi:3-dehydroquinate synthase